MIEQNNGTLRAIAWREVFPWLNIVRTFRLAIGFRVLVLGAIGAVLTVAGWWAIARTFAGDRPDAIVRQSATDAKAKEGQWLQSLENNPWKTTTGIVHDRPDWPQTPNPTGTVQWVAGQLQDPFLGTWRQLSMPLWEAFGLNVTLSGLAALALCGLWSLLVWAFIGGAITRIAAVQLASDERIGWMDAVRYAGSKYLAFFAAPLFPVVGILLAAIPICIFGFLLRAEVGVLLLALVWPLLLIAGLVMALLLLGLVFGWPLMWATISVEGTDSFDALSRSYAYVFQRPLRYLGYSLVAAVFGVIGWLLVSNFAAAVIALTSWAASWGGTGARMSQIITDVQTHQTTLGNVEWAGAVLIHFWNGCVKLLAVGYIYSYFWTASTAIYYLLRRDVDATEMDEVYLDADESEQDFGLPTLKTDETGAPVVDEDVPEITPDKTEPSPETAASPVPPTAPAAPEPGTPGA